MIFLRWLQGRLYSKYALYFVALVSTALLASGGLGFYFAYRETGTALFALQREKALGAVGRIEQFMREIEQQIDWARSPVTHEGRAREQRYLDFLRLLRQAPAVTEVLWLDSRGREQLKVSRLGMDRVGGGADYSREAYFLAARNGATWFGPVNFHKETEPYMTIAMASGSDRGVTVAQVNLKFVWDVVSRIQIGTSGYAYVVDANGRLVSHPDISLVLQNTDLSALPQVHTALAPGTHAPAEAPDPREGRDRAGRAVLAAFAPIPTLGWFVFVEQPLTDAYAPLYSFTARMALLLLLGLILSVVAGLLLARRMVTPIKALRAGAAQVGAGALDHRIEVQTGDELEALAEEFNRMAGRLRESYSGLEQKVEDRTRELAAANQAKSRFLAAASHDLRQPMHALGLFIAQLRGRIVDPDTLALVGKVEAAVTALQELLDSLLDISRLDAGIVKPTVADFRLQPLLGRLESAFAPQAERKGLRLRAVPTNLAVRSDPVLLERVLLNLLSNAVRYTERGGIVIGCRRRGSQVRIEVWDSGIGVAPEHAEAIFQEFYQLGNPERDRRKGLGLGLAIAARLSRLLGSRIDLHSRPGRGSVFAIEIPHGVADTADIPATPLVPTEILRDAQVLIVDDDALVRDAMASLLAQWGCRVASAANGDEAVGHLRDRLPDAVLCDYRLPNGETGVEVIARLRAAAGQELRAALVTGDTASERLREARQAGYPLLHKPLQPAKLRALLEQLLATRVSVSAPATSESQARARDG
jgi:signal transduction histidine kinase/ActR/RegA family two-component response regulator